ncbi:two component system sensor kinase [Chromobacterium phragmitis]|uniref:histidine kinase n=1 Tax=Chromobacterium phragmitis TaxID=2202141 RepID=A0A344UKY5_9NEIS|nr:two component system sensor kinase [Chromobacterium phragmitis]AXE30561.1 two component system sensor kinase [Chromobacterium phragmitis]AXE35933.1 two component system sensor kinase [Chromobacterium phragmitis]
MRFKYRQLLVHRPWKSSLPFRLCLVLCAAIVLFWTLSTGLVLFFEYREARSTLLRRVEMQATTRAVKQSEELRGIAREVHTLHRLWRALPENAGRVPQQYLAARYSADVPGHAGREPHLRRAMAFVEAFGGTCLGNLINTFALLDSGVVFSSASPQGQCGEDDPMRAHLAELRSHPARAGMLWGKPYQMPNGEWRMLVGEPDTASGVVIGVTVRLTALFDVGHLDALDEGVFAILDDEGKLLTPLPKPLSKELLKPLPDCYVPVSRRLDDFRAVCLRMELTGWRLIHLYPAGRLTEQAMSVLPRYLPMAVLILVLLMGLLYLVLQRSLGRTLDCFVKTISPRAAVGCQQRLSEEREDELGQIARAYNRLLNAVQAQYAELEAKVVERTQALEEARRRAERANAEKSEQINSISHEIRTPLNGLVGALMLLKRSDCDDSQRDLVDTSLKCSGHLLEIINNLLDFSRIESGHMVVTAASEDVLMVVDQAMLTVQLQALDKRLTLRTEIAASCPRALCTDGLRLRQILINLLGNAVKFTPAGEVALKVWSERERICFSVRDSGPGIEPEKQCEIFTAFMQIDSHVAGSGLGLPIARSLAQLLGGNLFLAPSDRGACFQLELPLGESRPEPAADRGPIVAPARLHAQLSAWGYQPQEGENPCLEAQELAYLPARLLQWLEPSVPLPPTADEACMPLSAWSLNVLVVDDVDTNRDIIGRMLRQMGHDSCGASGGEEALEQGRARVFDLILMDMRMPGMSGAEAMRRWRDPGMGMLDPDCPIFVLTANAQPGERERLLTAGFNEYLTKPVSLATLGRALELAADMQLCRGMELAPNTGMAKPMLLSDASLLERLGAELRYYYQKLGAALLARNIAECLGLLHTLKGLAGQAGLEQVQRESERWENSLRHAVAPRQESWIALGVLIEQSLARMV